MIQHGASFQFKPNHFAGIFGKSSQPVEQTAHSGVVRLWLMGLYAQEEQKKDVPPTEITETVIEVPSTEKSAKLTKKVERKVTRVGESVFTLPKLPPLLIPPVVPQKDDVLSYIRTTQYELRHLFLNIPKLVDKLKNQRDSVEEHNRRVLLLAL